MESPSSKYDVSDAIAHFGTLASFILIVTPIPQFNFWGLKQKEREQRME